LQRVAVFFERENAVFAGDRFGNQLDDRRTNRDVAQVDVTTPVFRRDRLRDLFRRYVPELFERLR
jgi:hypothetical protein